jgi:hypothetical protein
MVSNIVLSENRRTIDIYQLSQELEETIATQEAEIGRIAV